MNVSTRLCGYDLPEPITSSSNMLILIYQSDESVGHGKFSLEYEHIQGITKENI